MASRPHAAGRVWHDLAGELEPEGATADQVKEARELAYRRLEQAALSSAADSFEMTAPPWCR